jgi:hypothetical protein
MKLVYKVFYIIVLTVGASLLFVSMNKDMNMLTLINMVFLISLLEVLVGLLMHLNQQESLMRLRDAFKRFFMSLDRTNEYADQLEKKKVTQHYNKKNIPFKFPLLISGAILLVFSYCFSSLYW